MHRDTPDGRQPEGNGSFSCPRQNISPCGKSGCQVCQNRGQTMYTKHDLVYWERCILGEPVFWKSYHREIQSSTVELAPDFLKRSHSRQLIFGQWVRKMGVISMSYNCHSQSLYSACRSKQCMTWMRLWGPFPCRLNHNTSDSMLGFSHSNSNKVTVICHTSWLV